MRVRNVMQGEVVCVSPELRVGDLQEVLAGQEISGVPVTDENGGLVGIVSKTDIIELFSQTRLDPEAASAVLGDTPVSEVMTTEVVTVGADDDAASAAKRMVDARVHRAVVLDQGEVEGIVSSLDLLALLV